MTLSQISDRLLAVQQTQTPTTIRIKAMMLIPVIAAYAGVYVTAMIIQMNRVINTSATKRIQKTLAGPDLQQSFRQDLILVQQPVAHAGFSD